MELIDTHCHVHFKDYPLDPEGAIKAAQKKGVTRLVCVGTTLKDSRLAAEFARAHDNVWASAGVHPHDASKFNEDAASQDELKKILNKSSICAVGEIGLDYYKNYSPREEQQKALRLQIEAGLPTGLPFIFHVRDAWEDFWQVFDRYPGLRGVVHSFSTTEEHLEQALSRGLFIGLNGIMTFTKDEAQLAAAKAVPLDRLLLETDAPFLAPNPYRGKTCEPKYVAAVAAFLAELRQEPIAKLAKHTTKNAQSLFDLD